MKKLFLTGLGSFIFGIIHSQEIELDAVTVSSSITQQLISKSGRNIFVIKGSSFNNLPVHSIDELLRYLPGVEVQQRGAMGSQSDIVLRGGTFQQVLVVLDGLRINDPNTGHFNAYIPISPNEIERIEILKGASSAIYGSEAVGGVIHIISKTFAAKSTDNKEFLFQATGGEYDLWSIHAGGTYQRKGTAISGGVLTNNTDGQPQRGTRGFLHNTTASLSVKQSITENLSIAARSSYDIRDFSAQNFYTTFVSDTATEKVKLFWNQLQVQYKAGRHSLNFDAGYKNVKDHYGYNSKATANENESYLLQGSITDNFKLSQNSNLINGIQYQRKQIRSNDRGDHDLDQLASFIIWDQTINKFNFSPSIRLDWNERRGSELVPQLNLSYKLNKFQFRASGGKTIRDADFTERYNNYNKTLVTGGSIGNPDLKAERSFSYEAGADFFGKNFRLSATAFCRDQDNVIDWTPTPYAQMPRKVNLSPAGTYALASNIAEVTVSGIEADIQFTKHFKGHHNIYSTLGLVWLDSETGELKPSFYISSHAKFLANFNVIYSNKYLSFSANGIFKHRNPQEAAAINAHIDENCFMMNSKIEGFVNKHFSIFVEVDNIFDAHCGDLLGSMLPGRWLMGGIKIKL